MSHAIGADVQAAITEILQAGWSVRRLSADLQVHPTSVYRWRNGSRTPNKANFAALVQLAEMEYAAENCRPGTRGVVLLHLQRAYELLETDQQREAEDTRAAELAEQMGAGRRRRSQEAAAKYAVARAMVVEQRTAGQAEIAAAVTAADGQLRKSAYADADVFEVFGQEGRQMAAIERAFA